LRQNLNQGREEKISEEEKNQQHLNKDGKLPPTKEMREEKSGNVDKDNTMKEEGKIMDESKTTLVSVGTVEKLVTNLRILSNR
jgi:hypothetical protein